MNDKTAQRGRNALLSDRPAPVQIGGKPAREYFREGYFGAFNFAGWNGRYETLGEAVDAAEGFLRTYRRQVWPYDWHWLHGAFLVAHRDPIWASDGNWVMLVDACRKRLA